MVIKTKTSNQVEATMLPKFKDGLNYAEDDLSRLPPELHRPSVDVLMSASTVLASSSHSKSNSSTLALACS